jgi:hypothetical protein
MKTELFVKNKLFVSVITVLLLVGCSGGSDSSDQNSDLSSQNEAPLSPLEKFQNAKIDLLNGLSSGYLIYLGDDSISDMRSVTLDADPEYKRISVSYDLAIDRGLFDDIYGANSSVNAPALLCDSIRDEAMSKIFSVLKKNEDLIDSPSEGYEISLFWNVYDKFEDSFGGSEYKEVRKYGMDKVGISVSNWNQIKFDEYFETNAKFINLSDLFKPTKNSYPRGRCLWEP